MIADRRLPNGKWEITFRSGSVVTWRIKNRTATVLKNTNPVSSFKVGSVFSNDGFYGCIARRVGVKEYYENF